MIHNNQNHPNKVPLTFEEVARYPLPGMTMPGNWQFSADDRWITYLFSPERSLTRYLFAYDPDSDIHLQLTGQEAVPTSEENISREEALRRERLRQRELGVTQYAWSQHGNRLLVPIRGDLYVKDGPDAPLRKIFESQGSPAVDAKFSPDGEWVAFVRSGEIWVIPSDGGQAVQVTCGGNGDTIFHGLAEYIAQEEMDRSSGFWWSPESRRIAFCEVDESSIPLYQIVHQGKDEIEVEEHRYPFTGKENARVRLGVISREGEKVVWMDLNEYRDAYLARVAWMPDGSLAAQIQNREQSELELIRFDPATGKGELLLKEINLAGVNLNNFFKPLKTGGFIWGSERSGFRHLYYYPAGSKDGSALTQGEWFVDDLAGVDEKEGLVYFTGSLDSPLESQLYVVPLSGGQPRRLTQEPGMHAVVMDHRMRRFVDVHHSLEQPHSVYLKSSTDGSTLARLFSPNDPRLESLDLKAPELVTLKNRKGITLYGAIYHPQTEAKGPLPTIVYVYGGPHVQQVANKWDLVVNLRAQYLAQQGYLVFVLDNRGSARRGFAFENAVCNDLGHLEVEDQVDGVEYLVKRGLTDPARVGIYGWSYGGYMSAMCLARAPETFKVGVAGAPVTSWDGYDTHYTERYMGTPRSNPQGYEASSIISHVEKIRGKLMIVHGLIDENVHFRHTARLINALIAARKEYELLVFPDERHMPRKLEDRVYMEERICNYFEQNL
jgi:dipeptidyl-peptidase 4